MPMTDSLYNSTHALSIRDPDPLFGLQNGLAHQHNWCKQSLSFYQLVYMTSTPTHTAGWSSPGELTDPTNDLWERINGGAMKITNSF